MKNYLLPLSASENKPALGLYQEPKILDFKYASANNHKQPNLFVLFKPPTPKLTIIANNHKINKIQFHYL